MELTYVHNLFIPIFEDKTEFQQQRKCEKETKKIKRFNTTKYDTF